MSSKQRALPGTHGWRRGLQVARRSAAQSIAISLLAVLPARAQLASDQVPRERTIPLSRQVEQELAEARHLGPLRVIPMFDLRNLGYDNNVFGTQENPVADWRATVAGGGRLLLPFGPKMVLRGDLVPEYTWFRKTTQFRQFGGTYNAALLGFLNRMTLEGRGEIHKTLSPVSSELAASAPGTQTSAVGRAEVDIFQRLSVFGSVEKQRQAYSSSGDAALLARIRDLERDDTVARGGLRYKFASFLDLTAAMEKTKSDFDQNPQLRNNQSDAVIFGVHYDRPRMFINVSAGARKGKPADASSFRPYSTTTGSYYASYRLTAPIALDAYGHRSVVYGLYPDNPYFFESRNGLGVTVPIGHRLAFRAFGETGSNDYPVPVTVAGAAVRRSDDATRYGGGVGFRLYRQIAITVLATSSKYTSNVAGFDRSILQLTAGLSLRGDFIP